MNGVKIGSGSIIGAGSVVLEGEIVPPFSMVAGSPAKVRKTYHENILMHIREVSRIYVQRASLYRRKVKKNLGIV